MPRKASNLVQNIESGWDVIVYIWHLRTIGGHSVASKEAFFCTDVIANQTGAPRADPVTMDLSADAR